MSRRLLAVSWATLPMVAPRSIQVARSLKAMRALGWESDVICAETPADWTTDLELHERYRESYETVRVATTQPQNARALWRRLLRRPIDPEAGWMDAATSAAVARAKTRPFDALITFAQPWSDHKIGLRVAKATGLPWIAHFSDPWADNPYTRTLAARQLEEAKVAERRVVAAADAIIFPTARMADLVMAKYPSDRREKVAIVPHGFEDESHSIRANPRRGDRLRVVHAGDFYGVRSPAALIEAVGRLNIGEGARELEIVFVGLVPEEHCRTADELGLKDVVRFKGRMSYTAAAREMASAEALLVVDAPGQESVFLPSKLVDYLAFARPIIGLTPRSGASADLLERLGCPSVEPDDVAGIESTLRATLDAWRNGRLGVTPRFHATASEYEIGRTTSHLNDAIIAAVVRNGGNGGNGGNGAPIARSSARKLETSPSA